MDDTTSEQFTEKSGISSTSPNRIEISNDLSYGEINRKAVDRMKICLQCEHFLKITKQCKKCGCFMPIKTRMPQQKCPVDKW